MTAESKVQDLMDALDTSVREAKAARQKHSEWMREKEARDREAREQRRNEFFVVDGRTDIPDLEFLTPDCPVCGLYTVAEDGQFICEECGIVWPGSGYGHEARRDA